MSGLPYILPFGLGDSTAVLAVTANRTAVLTQARTAPAVLPVTATLSAALTQSGAVATLAVTANRSATLARNVYISASLTVTAATTVAAIPRELEVLCETGLATIKRHERDEDLLRRQQPFVRIWDAEWHLQHILTVDYKSQWSWISNDSGPGRSEIPFDTPVAAWIADETGRLARDEGRNVHVSVDYCGARWSGRMDKFSIEQRDDGDVVLVVDWLHDYENLKWYSVWSNPFLPALFQFPRAFLLAGPVTWCLKLSLFLQLFREHNPLLTWPDDPLDLSQWWSDLDMKTWNVTVAPNSFMSSLESGVVWGLLSSRFTNWHDAAHTMLEDSELSVVCRRYLPGDPPPWNGAENQLRYGVLIVDIADKSGVYVGTSHGGSIFSGLIRTVVEFADDFIDSTENIIADTAVPENYWNIGHKYTDKALPYVIYRSGDQNNNSPIQTSQFINSPGKGVQVTVGGHSMPGVNEAISATIQALGDLFGGLIQIGSFGGSIDALLKPLYEDVILAWWSVKSSQKAQNSGWSRYFEYFQEGSSKAYTIASLMVLRAGFWATKTVVSWKVTVNDGLPYTVGDSGLGHFWLDDRVGLVLAGDHIIHMDRCRKIDLAWTEDSPPEWTISIGDDRIWQDPAQRAWGKIEAMVAALRELGVWSLVAVGLSASVLAFNFSSDDSASPTQTSATGANISVVRGELVPAHTVSFGGVAVGSMTNLVNSVFTV